MSGRGCRSLLFYSQEEAIITSAQCAELCRQRLPPVERYSQRVFFGKASFETEHYIRPPGSNNRFHEMLACRSCCVPLSHVYVCVTEGAAFQLFVSPSVPAACLNYAEPGIATEQKNVPVQQISQNTTHYGSRAERLADLCNKFQTEQGESSLW